MTPGVIFSWSYGVFKLRRRVRALPIREEKGRGFPCRNIYTMSLLPPPPLFSIVLDETYKITGGINVYALCSFFYRLMRFVNVERMISRRTVFASFYIKMGSLFGNKCIPTFRSYSLVRAHLRRLLSPLPTFSFVFLALWKLTKSIYAPTLVLSIHGVTSHVVYLFCTSTGAVLEAMHVAVTWARYSE